MSTPITYKYFSIKELQCKCGCGECHMDDNFMDRLDLAREMAGIPFPINSGFRCSKYDKKMDGATNHPSGKAVDIKTETGKTMMIIISCLIRVGFQRIGISFKDKFIHVDCVPDRPTPCIWGYNNG